MSKFIVSLLFLSVFAIQSSACAGNEWKHDDEEYKVPHTITMDFKRLPHSAEGEATLQLRAPGVMSTCLAVSELEHKTRYDGQFLDVEVKGYTIDTENKPRACRNEQKYAFANIPMNRQMLQEEGVKKIRLRSNGQQDNYDIVFGHGYMELIPQKQAFMFKPARSETLKFWFYPKNTVVLTVPTANSTENIDIQVRQLASANGLTPLEVLYPRFESANSASHHYYFIDEGSRYVNAGAFKTQLGYITPLFRPSESPKYFRPRYTQHAVFVHTPGGV